MIYFMQPVGGGPVKIGYTDDISRRTEQLERHYGCALCILATMPGQEKREREIHSLFDHLRLVVPGRRGRRTEQFRPAPELMEFIDKPFSDCEADGLPLPPRSPEAVVRFPGWLYQRIQAAADQEGNSVAAFIRSAVVKELKRREKEAAE